MPLKDCGSIDQLPDWPAATCYALIGSGETSKGVAELSLWDGLAQMALMVAAGDGGSTASGDPSVPIRRALAVGLYYDLWC